MTTDDPSKRDWSQAGPKVPNQKGVFVGFFSGGFLGLSMKKGGPVRGQPSLEHALLIERATEETKADAAKPHLTADIRYYFKTGRCIERPDWAQVRDQILWDLLLEKYGMPLHPNTPERTASRVLLLESHPAYLEDGNIACENHFGVCRCPKCLRKLGANIHGRLLMSLRDKLINPGVVPDTTVK